MRKRRIGILEWESTINTISITTQENKYQDVLANDSLQSMKDTEREMNEIALIKQKNDRVYYTRNNKQ
jgi:hypothetical protein